MRTNVLYIATAAIFLFGLVSCTDNLSYQDSSIQVGAPLNLTAYLESGYETKTGLVDNGSGGKSVVWRSGDAISLFFNSGSDGGDKFTTTTNGPIASFSGSLSAVSGSLSSIGGEAWFWATYPYNASASCDGNALTTELSVSQPSCPGDVMDNLLVTVGRSENMAIYFRSICAVIGFTVCQEGITRIIFEGNAGEAVSGVFSVSFDEEEEVVISPTVNSSNYVEITPAGSTEFVTATRYYFAILPGSFDSGYKLTFIRNDGSSASYTRTTPFTFARSMFYTMTNKDDGLHFIPLSSGISSLTLSQNTLQAYVNDTYQLTATAIDVQGADLSDDNDVQWFWKTSNAEVASVSGSSCQSYITGHKAGTAIISVIAKPSKGIPVTSSCIVTVADVPSIEYQFLDIFYGEANCVIAYNVSNTTIDVTPYQTGEHFTQTNIRAYPDITQTPAKAYLIWRENTLSLNIEENVSGNAIQVSGIQGTGNAVVGVYNICRQLLWSYHLWVPGFDTESDCLEINGKTMMRAALGATSAWPSSAPSSIDYSASGLFYQWGRKDPLGRLAAIKTLTTMSEGNALGASCPDISYIDARDAIATIDTDEETGIETDFIKLLKYSFINPSRIIYYTSYSTYTTFGSDYDCLWGNDGNTDYGKTIFDPSPKGWRVPDLTLYGTESISSKTISRVANYPISNPSDIWLHFGERDVAGYTTTSGSGYFCTRVPIAGSSNCYYMSAVDNSQINPASGSSSSANADRSRGRLIRCVADYSFSE